MSYELSRIPGMAMISAMDTGVKTSLALDEAFTLGVSGKAVIIGFIAPVSQSSGTLTVHAYVDSVTGTPTDIRASILATSASDPDRYTGFALATSSAVDCSSSANTWASFPLAGVTLTAGEHYWIAIDNRTASPAGNSVNICYRGGFDGNGSANMHKLFTGGYTTGGFSADATMTPYLASAVIRFADGALMGNPFVNVAYGAADNANDRGNRVRFAEDVVVSGVLTGVASGNSSLGSIKIYQGSTPVASQSFSYFGRQRLIGVRFDTPVTLCGNTTYDVVISVNAATNAGIVFDMGQSCPPTDVLNCRPVIDTVRWAYVNGAAPGSYTVDETRFFKMALIIDSNPQQATGSSYISPRGAVYANVRQLGL